MPNAFVSESAIEEIVAEIAQQFEYSLHSRSSVSELLNITLPIMAERKFPKRRSLAMLIARRAQIRWLSAIAHAQAVNQGQS